MTGGDEAGRLTYSDVLSVEHGPDPEGTGRLTRVSLSLALQSAEIDDASSFGLLPLPRPWAKPADGAEAQAALERGLGEFGFVRLNARPVASRPSRVYLVPRAPLRRLAALAGGEPFLYCGPETAGTLVVVREDGAQEGDATPTPSGIVRLASQVANAPVSFVHPPQTYAQARMRKAYDDRRPGPPFDDLSTVIYHDEPAKALKTVLEGLAPQRVRQFVERLVIQAAPLASGYDSASEGSLSIRIEAPSETERLTRENGRFVALLFSGSPGAGGKPAGVPSEFDLLDEYMRDASRRGAPDLRIDDEANGLAVLVECQKAYFQTPHRLRRNLGALFDEGSDADSVSVDATFGMALSLLSEIADRGGVAAEINTVRQFGNYLSATGLAA